MGWEITIMPPGASYQDEFGNWYDEQGNMIASASGGQYPQVSQPGNQAGATRGQPSGLLAQQYGRMGPTAQGFAQAAGAAGILGGLFGGGGGPSAQEIEQLGLARSGQSAAQQFGGRMMSTGMGMERSGQVMRDQGRSGYMDALMNPRNSIAAQGQLASQLGAAQRGSNFRAGITGGPLSGAQFARNQAGISNLGMGLSNIINKGIENRGRGYQAMTGFGDQDMSRGLQLQGSGFGTINQGNSQLMGILGQQAAAAQARAAQRQQAIQGAVGMAAKAGSGGIF
jgi:hypothetical protein